MESLSEHTIRMGEKKILSLQKKKGYTYSFLIYPNYIMLFPFTFEDIH